MAVDIKRRLARGVAVIAIALAAGQLVESMSKGKPAPQQASAAEAKKPKNVETLTAGAETAKPATVADRPLPQTASITAMPDAATPAPAALPAPAAVAQTAPVAPKPTAPAAPLPAVAVVDACPVTLDLSNGANAMIGLTLVSPCHPNERVVLQHAGLAVTAVTTMTGALFVDLPALEQDAIVKVMFKDATSVSAMIAVPEIASIRRFAVQWQADDAFQLHAFESGSGYDGLGHISDADQHLPVAGAPAKGGFLTLLGDSTTDMPLLAQLYTFPDDLTAKPEIVVEAAISATTCGREILGETVTSMNGKVSIGDLTLAMPDCTSIGDYLVLKNLVPDLSIASSE